MTRKPCGWAATSLLVLRRTGSPTKVRRVKTPKHSTLQKRQGEATAGNPSLGCVVFQAASQSPELPRCQALCILLSAPLRSPSPSWEAGAYFLNLKASVSIVFKDRFSFSIYIIYLFIFNPSNYNTEHPCASTCISYSDFKCLLKTVKTKYILPNSLHLTSVLVLWQKQTKALQV